MRAVFQRIRVYMETRDASSCLLVTAGFVLIALLAESIKLHREVGPQGGHHGDVAGGFLLFGFLFSTVPFILVFAVVGALLSKSTAPLLGTIAGLIASIPILLVVGIISVFLGDISPLLGALFPFAVGIALAVMGLLKRTRATETGARAP